MTKRDEIDKLYHKPSWQRVRQSVLARDHYLCQECLRHGIITPANTVHHKVHARDDVTKFYDADNLEAICLSCHNREHPEKLDKAKQALEVEKRKEELKEEALGVVKFKQNDELL